MNFAQEVCKVTRFLVCCCCFVLPHRDKKHILKRILRTLRNVHRLMAFKLGAFQGIISMLLLLLLNCFSRVWLCAIPQTAAHQAPLSLGFSRQEDWSGLPFPSPPSPLLALFIVMLPNAHLTSHSRMSPRWVTTPSWLSSSLRPFWYNSSVYSCHLFLISSAFC